MQEPNKLMQVGAAIQALGLSFIGCGCLIMVIACVGLLGIALIF